MSKATICDRVSTDQPVAFITLDDGYFDDPIATAFVAGDPFANPPVPPIPVTQFLTYYAASSGAYPPPVSGPGHDHIVELRKYQTGNSTQRRVGCHAKEHIDYRDQSVTDQKNMMNDSATWLGGTDMFTYRPTLYRPPYGYWDDATLQAASLALMPKMVLWTHAVMDLGDGWELVNEWGYPRVHRGDILLLHHPSNTENGANVGYLKGQLDVALAAINGANLQPAYLHDYL